jgi:hypothetical protein
MTTALSFTHWIWFAMIAEKRRKNCNIAEKFKFNILLFNDISQPFLRFIYFKSFDNLTQACAIVHAFRLRDNDTARTQ